MLAVETLVVVAIAVAKMVAQKIAGCSLSPLKVYLLQPVLQLQR